MISAAKKTSNPSARGFTILEMVVTIGIAMLLMGGALAVILFNTDERRLSDGLSKIELLAKRARTVATLQQRPYALEFSRQGVALMPYGEALMEPNRRDDLIEEFEFQARSRDLRGESSGASESSIRDRWEPDDDTLKILIRRWGNTDWQLLDRNDRHVWRFDPQGISEPVGVRLETEKGSWMMAFFHPLTAAIAETQSEIQ